MLHVEEAGNPAGPPLVLVHGFLSSNAQWDLNRHALGEHYRLLMVELLGHGRSDAPDDSSAYTIESMSRHFEQVRIERGIKRWWVCGQSLGGAISILYALLHPQTVRGLIFTNSRAAFGLPRQGLRDETGQPRPAIASTRELPVHPINAKRLPEHVQARMVAAADVMPMHAVNHYMARRHTWKSTQDMALLTIPVLLVNGRWESAFQPSVEQAQQLIRHLEVVSLEGGHAINVEQPQAFNQAVVGFIERHGDGQ